MRKVKEMLRLHFEVGLQAWDRHRTSETAPRASPSATPPSNPYLPTISPPPDMVRIHPEGARSEAGSPPRHHSARRGICISNPALPW